MAGGVIIDGRTRFKYRGSIEQLKNALGKLGKRANAGLMIGTWPLPERNRTGIEITFAGSVADFGKVVDGLERLRTGVAIETVPLPEKPVPPSRRRPLQWKVSARKRSRQKRPKR